MIIYLCRWGKIASNVCHMQIRRPLWGHQASEILLFSSCPSFVLPMDVPDCRLASTPPSCTKPGKSLRECPDASGAQFLSDFGDVYIVVAFFLSSGTPSDPQD